MKKVLALLATMAILIICSMSATAAGNVQLGKSQSSGSTTVGFGLSEQYTVTIPSTINMTVNNEYATGNIHIDAANATLGWDRYLSVAIVNSPEYDTVNKKFRMTDGHGTYLDLNVLQNNKTYNMYYPVFLVECPDESGSTNFELSASIPKDLAGNFHTTFTFEVEVKQNK